MNKHFLILVASLLSILIAGACVGSSQETETAHDAFVRAYLAAKSDGVIDQGELDQLALLFQNYIGQLEQDMAGVDWTTIGVSALSGIIFALTGIRVIPNRMILGKNATAKLGI
jgi:hypothetical protein